MRANEMGPALVGRWYWYRPSIVAETFPPRVIDIGKIEYAWLCDPTARDSELRRVAECAGEFLPMEDSR